MLVKCLCGSTGADVWDHLVVELLYQALHMEQHFCDTVTARLEAALVGREEIVDLFMQ